MRLNALRFDDAVGGLNGVRVLNEYLSCWNLLSATEILGRSGGVVTRSRSGWRLDNTGVLSVWLN